MSNNLQAGQQTQSTRATTVRQNSKGKKVWQHWKLVLGILIGIVLLFFWRGCALEYKANAPARAEAERAEAEAKKAETVQETPVRVEMTETLLDLDEVEWTEVIAYRGQCTWFLTPPGATVHAQARSSEPGAVWVDWVDWKSTQFGALRFRGTQVIIKQKATEPDGSCKYT